MPLRKSDVPAIVTFWSVLWPPVLELLLTTTNNNNNYYGFPTTTTTTNNNNNYYYYYYYYYYASKVTLLAAMSHHPRYLSQTRIASFPRQQLDWSYNSSSLVHKSFKSQRHQHADCGNSAVVWQLARLDAAFLCACPFHLRLSRNKVTRLDVCMSSLRRGHTGCHNREHICNRISRARAKTKATLRTPILKLSEFKIVAGEFASLVSTCFARQHTDPTFSVGFFLQATAITPHV